MDDLNCTTINMDDLNSLLSEACSGEATEGTNIRGKQLTFDSALVGDVGKKTTNPSAGSGSSRASRTR